MHYALDIQELLIQFVDIFFGRAVAVLFSLLGDDLLELQKGIRIFNCLNF